MAGGQMFQVKGSQRANTFIAKKKSVKWGKMSKVSNSVKSYVKKAINKNEETKYHDSFSVSDTVGTYGTFAGTPIVNSAPKAGAHIVGLNQFPTPANTVLYDGGTDATFVQGNDNNQRIGDVINCSRIVVHGKYTIDPLVTDTQVIKVMVIKENECADRANIGTISDLTVLHTRYDELGFQNMDQVAELKNFKIVKNKTYKFDSSFGKNFYFTLKIKVNKKLVYSDSTGQTLKDRYWLLLWSVDEAGNNNSFKIQSRMYFKDA